MDIERPSGKGTAEENFPVGSVLIALRLRPHVAAFYAFARAADDIADDPALPPDDKIARLDRLAAAILGRETDDAALEKAHRLRRSLADTGLGPTHCTDLLAAFKQDATKNRYADWGELMDYCELSACPVGRFVLDLHREARASYAASDALCSALQVINHLQDARHDYRTLDRVYVPLGWMTAEGTDVSDLDARQLSASMRRVFDRCLDAVAELLAEARIARRSKEHAASDGIGRHPAPRGSAGDAAPPPRSVGRAHRPQPPHACRPRRLGRRSRPRTPNARWTQIRAHTPRHRWLEHVTRDVTSQQTSDAAAYVRRIAARSGSSFVWGMRILPRARREAMYAIYASCREVDDIADGPGETADRLQRLAEWRTEVESLYAGRPSRPVAWALAPAVAAYGLQREEFLAIIEGMEMDLRDSMRAPSSAELDAYCRRVAGAVGLLSVRVFGATEPEARTLAVVLGRTLQLTNILRDLAEDAELGRLYLPRETLRAHGIETNEPAAALAHPGLPAACADLAADARAGFAETRRLLAHCDKRRLGPSVAMMEVYERILGLLEARGWHQPGREVRVSSAEKLWIAVRLGLAW